MPTQKRTQNATHNPPTPHKTSQPKRLQPTQQHTVLGACELGDGFAGGGEEFGEGELVVGLFGFGSCGVEGRGVDEVLEVVQ
jgi:hypothetical protein